MNTYGYVKGNPINSFDFYGLRSDCEQCYMDCNTKFKWGYDDLKQDFYGPEMARCQMMRSPSACSYGTSKLAEYLEDQNERKFMECMDQCTKVDCKEDSICH